MPANNTYIYEWGPAKAAANLAKHGVSFEAVYGFEWGSAKIEPDSRADYGEERLEALGYIKRRLHSLVFTRRGPSIRVISLRKANKREQADYEEAT